MNRSRNQAVELWRLLFTFSIVLNHSMVLPWYRFNRGYLWCTSLGVEFFFVLSGYLMAASVRRMPLPCESLGEDTWRFLWRKVKSIYPVFLFAAVFDQLIAYALRGGVSSTTSYSAFLWDLLFLRGTGLGNGFDLLVGASWYIPAMLLGMALMFPLLRKYPDTFLHILAPLLAVFLCGWFMVKYNKLDHQLQFNEAGICLGLLRAIACMSAGCLSFLAVEKCKARPGKSGRLRSILWTAAEFLGFLGAIWIATHYRRGPQDFVALFLICVGLTAAFSGKSLTGKWTAKLNVSWIGEYSLALYLNHVVWVKTFNAWKLPIPWKKQAVLLVILSVLTALVCFFFLRLLRQLMEKWKSYRADTAAQSE